jgi:2-polyprenyl-3-methyl-5-hydroxy-6-metoxy-1,4-benzoquinol methylase
MQVMSINSGYYENERPEIFCLIDKESKVILDVGCGKGRLGANLKRDVAGRKVVGIEHNEHVADAAREVLDEVLVGDVQTMQLPFEHGMFDCMVFGDILEHLIEPEMVLHKLKIFLKSDGIIICSIPNMRHYTVFLKLFLRGWQYEEYGHFDRTHLRFFSLSSMKEMVEGAGFRILQIIPRIDASKKMRIFNTLCAGRLEEFVAFHYLIKAKNHEGNQ